MKQIRGTNINAVLLQVAVVGLLLALTPAVAQTNDSTTTNTTTTTTQDSTNVGMVEGVPVRKDAWNWYWNEKAHLDIDTQDNAHFWGDDVISNFFRNISNSFVIPFWNAAMEYDFIRVAVLLVLAGMLLGLGASVFLPKKPDK